MAVARNPKLELPVEIDLDACELECLVDMLMHSKESTLRLLAERIPRPVPPKQRKDLRTIQASIIERWVRPDVRAYLQEFIFAAGQKLRARVHDRRAVKALLERRLLPGTILYLAHLEGLSPSRMLASFPAAARREFEERQSVVQEFIGVLNRQRDGKMEQGQRAIDAAIAKATERRTRELRERIEVVSRKHEKAQDAIANVATTLKRQTETLRKDLDASREQVTALASTVEAQRQTIEDLKGQLASEAAKVRDAGRHALYVALSGVRVLVVGDDNRQVVYRDEVERFGGEFEFLSGFCEPRRAGEKAAAADLIVLVTSFVSHKVSGRLDAFGRVVLRVNNGGEQSMREALTRYVLDLLLKEGA